MTDPVLANHALVDDPRRGPGRALLRTMCLDDVDFRKPLTADDRDAHPRRQRRRRVLRRDLDRADEAYHP